MVREIRVHDDYEITSRELQAMNVCGAKAEFAGARVEFDVVCAVGFDELFGDVLRSVGGAVVDDYDFPVKFAGERVSDELSHELSPWVGRIDKTYCSVKV